MCVCVCACVCVCVVCVCVCRVCVCMCVCVCVCRVCACVWCVLLCENYTPCIPLVTPLGFIEAPTVKQNSLEIYLQHAVLDPMIKEHRTTCITTTGDLVHTTCICKTLHCTCIPVCYTQGGYKITDTLANVPTSIRHGTDRNCKKYLALSPE